jgi:spermidine synthase
MPNAEETDPAELSQFFSAWVLICFFLSGATGLIYEILWTRMLVQVIGGAPFAVSTIRTVFMLGLGLGSYAASRRDRPGCRR